MKCPKSHRNFGWPNGKREHHVMESLGGLSLDILTFVILLGLTSKYKQPLLSY